MSKPCPLAVNVDFSNLTLLKAACRDWAIRKTFEFVTVPATKKRYAIVCKEEGCP
jgi:MuDR family transposase